METVILTERGILLCVGPSHIRSVVTSFALSDPRPSYYPRHLAYESRLGRFGRRADSGAMAFMDRQIRRAGRSASTTRLFLGRDTSDIKDLQLHVLSTVVRLPMRALPRYFRATIHGEFRCAFKVAQLKTLYYPRLELQAVMA